MIEGRQVILNYVNIRASLPLSILITALILPNHSPTSHQYRPQFKIAVLEQRPRSKRQSRNAAKNNTNESDLFGLRSTRRWYDLMRGRRRWRVRTRRSGR
jgi:hypothetical protein